MSRTLQTLTIAALVLCAVPAHAGGSAELVRIFELKRLSDTAYRFVFEMRDGGEFLSGCRRVTVLGDFQRLVNAPPCYRGVSMQAHLDALEYLRVHARDGTNVWFGVMGAGLGVTSGAQPCVRQSRALQLHESPAGEVGVYSYHDAV